MSAQLDLVLVNPGNRKRMYQGLATNLSALEPPVWAGLMATFIRRKGFSVAVLDANAENLSPEETAQRLMDMNPLLTAMVIYGHNPSASTQVMPAARRAATALKELQPESKVLFVGGHVAALPERTLEEEPCDFVCTGEGPFTLAELVEALKAGDDLSRVRGLMYREAGAVRTNPIASNVSDLDNDMPGVAWDLLPMDLYRSHNWHCFDDLTRQPYGSIYTTLGCPFKCSFCCINAPFKAGGKRYRLWSPEVVLDQIDTLVKDYGVRHIKFADELFVMNRDHVFGVCDGIIERGYDLNIWTYARVDTVKDDMLDKLKRAGFNWLCFGIEAGSDRVRDDVSKGIGRGGIFDCLKKVRDAGIYIGANYIFGLPEDDHESMQATLDLAVEINAEWANFNAAMAYPGSELYEFAVREKWPLPDTWAGYAQHARDALPLPTKYLTGPEVLAFRDQAFQTYFTNPKYLDLIERTFGLDTVAHIREMTSHKLERQHAAPSSD